MPPVRVFGPAACFLALLLAAVPARAAAPAPSDDHGQATAALADIGGAIAVIVQTDASYSSDRAVYGAAARRADERLSRAVARIDHLLDRRETPVWADALRGAEANLRAASARLAAAGHARDLMGYQIAVTTALADIELARGRPDQIGVFGGLEGALATTVLGVPAGAATVDACAAPASAPSYGTHDGLLAFVALPASQGPHALTAPLGGTDVTIEGDFIVLHTAAAEAVGRACAGSNHAAARPQPAVPALYTTDQALAGEGAFMAHCAACHGTNLHGVSAPGVAGNDFLKTAKGNGWTLEVIRTLVFTMMPLNAAGTLPPVQYAQIMAYLLAANCYPAGSTPFPADDRPEFAKIQPAPDVGSRPGKDATGVCPVP